MLPALSILPVAARACSSNNNRNNSNPAGTPTAGASPQRRQ
jgi:hypothetical protein